MKSFHSNRDQNSTLANRSISTMPGSVKMKLSALYNFANGLLDEINDEAGQLNDFTNEVKNEFDAYREEPNEIRGGLEQRIDNLDTQIEKHFTHQKIENEKMQRDLTELKGDKSAIRMQLKEAESNLEQIELAIGVEVPMQEMNYE